MSGCHMGECTFQIILRKGFLDFYPDVTELIFKIAVKRLKTFSSFRLSFRNTMHN
jgi:hypothetical protein